MVRTGRVLWVCVGLMAGLATAAPCRSQEVAPQEAAPPAVQAKPSKDARQDVGRVGRGSLLQLVKQANPMLWPLVVCSVVTLGFALERGFALRRGRVIPKDFVSRFLDRLSSGKLDRDRAAELCRSNDSAVSRIFGHAVRYWGQPASTIRQALDHDAAVELLELKRNVRMLNGTATLAPLLGLLGTVVGMIESFDALGAGKTAGAAKSEALAHGISLALLATAFGLGIAIVSVAFYYYYLQRIDILARDLDEQARLVIDLIASDASRGGAILARGPMHGLGDPGRLESRPLGRVDPL